MPLNPLKRFKRDGQESEPLPASLPVARERRRRGEGLSSLIEDLVRQHVFRGGRVKLTFKLPEVNVKVFGHEGKVELEVTVTSEDGVSRPSGQLKVRGLPEAEGLIELGEVD